jgi:TetR/AcrR family transcriptional repressor of nem operon
MARTRGFDLDKAIDKATLLFWKKGYANTSLRDLLQAMGIGEGSFYNTVKSKKNLYLLCLARYNDTVGRRRLQALQSGATAGEGIRHFFKTVLDDLDDPKTPRVCLVASSMSVNVLEDRSLKAPVLKEMQGFVRAFEARLQGGVDTGELPAGFDAHAVAQLLLTYLQGLFSVIRVLQTRAETERQLEAMLAGLGL